MRVNSSAVIVSVIRVLLVDDEALARRGIRQLLASHADVTIIGECSNGLDALAAICADVPDVVFLDVQMPELDGMGVMRRVIAERGMDHVPVTVFLTAYEEFALDAFEVEATDYLLKPVSDERFAAAMQRVRRRLASGPDPLQPRARSDQHLLIPTAKGHRVIALDEIDWIGADDYYAAVNSGGRRYLLRETMTSLEARLDAASFVRVHRAAIVNIARIRELTSADGDMIVILADGTRLPVSRRRRAALSRALV
ncbi:MAG: LytTr DNA-binding region [Gemmatimonadetes bacterium]|nr:LytTr DNA-binding region [Gemmatimonadota bacterium]